MDKKSNHTIPLQRGIIYGPVNSRRLGRSLGINILPTRIKLCTFNCVYCQYGWARPSSQAHPLPQIPEIITALEDALQRLSSPPAYLTFSGNGEPTLHPDFAAIADQVIRLRNQYLPEARTAVLSNSSTVSWPAVRDAVSGLDVRIMKLDCGLEKCFRAFNRPARGIKFKTITTGLKELPDVTIQSLFAGGPGGNFTSDNLDAWIAAVKEIKPVEVQIYTLDRGYSSRKILPVTRDALVQLKGRLQQQGITANAY